LSFKPTASAQNLIQIVIIPARIRARRNQKNFSSRHISATKNQSLQSSPSYLCNRESKDTLDTLYHSRNIQIFKLSQLHQFIERTNVLLFFIISIYGTNRCEIISHYIGAENEIIYVHTLTFQ